MPHLPATRGSPAGRADAVRRDGLRLTGPVEGTGDDGAGAGAGQGGQYSVGALLRRATLPALAVLLLVWALSCHRPGHRGPPARSSRPPPSPSWPAPRPWSRCSPFRSPHWPVADDAGSVWGSRWSPLPCPGSSWRPTPAATSLRRGSGAAAVSVRVMVVNAQEGRGSAEDIVAAVTGNAIDVLVVTELTGEPGPRPDHCRPGRPGHRTLGPDSRDRTASPSTRGGDGGLDPAAGR